MSWRESGFGVENSREWQIYADFFEYSNVKFSEKDDQLAWSRNLLGIYVPKLGYKARVEEGREDLHPW